MSQRIFEKKNIILLLKSSRHKKDLNDVTVAPFLVSFSQLPAAKKLVSALTSLRFFLFRDDFTARLQ